ncbi:MAG: hypothetical protein ACLUD2_06540 [Clostridium sp.]
MVRNRQIHRTYLAAVSGNLSGQPEGTIDVPIARLPGSTIERIPDPVRGEAALTHYELLYYQPQSDTSLLKNPTGNRTYPPDSGPYEAYRPSPLR